LQVATSDGFSFLARVPNEFGFYWWYSHDVLIWSLLVVYLEKKIPRLMLQRISWVPYKMGITTITLKMKDNFLFPNV
jgi:hypothetical protein